MHDWAYGVFIQQRQHEATRLRAPIEPRVIVTGPDPFLQRKRMGVDMLEGENQCQKTWRAKLFSSVYHLGRLAQPPQAEGFPEAGKKGSQVDLRTKQERAFASRDLR